MNNKLQYQIELNSVKLFYKKHSIFQNQFFKIRSSFLKMSN